MAVSTADVVEQHLRGRKLDAKGFAFQAALLLALFLALLFLVVLLVDVFRDGFSVLSSRGGDFLSGNLSSFPDRAGVGQALRGSLLLMVFVVVIAFPLGIGAAVYLEEYAKDTRFNRFINSNIRNLAGVPSVVYGLLGLALFVEYLEPFTGGRSLMSAGITLAILVLPIVIITSAEALRAVPESIREAGYGVGATKWEVVRSHVLPSAAPGILTGTILSISRAIGEAAPLLLIGAVTGLLGNAGGLFDQLRDRFTGLPIVIYQWAQEADRDFRPLVSGGIIVLMAVILVLNLAAILLRNRYERKW
jgi:phosphate transport system permease protein